MQLATSGCLTFLWSRHLWTLRITIAGENTSLRPLHKEQLRQSDRIAPSLVSHGQRRFTGAGSSLGTNPHHKLDNDVTRNLQETTRSLVGNLLSLFQLQLLPRAVHSQHHLSGQACSPANQISDASTAGLGRQGFLDTFFGCVRGGHQEGPIRVSQGFQPSHFPCVKGASTVSAHCIKMEEPKDQGELCVSHPTSEDVAHSPVDLAHPNGVDTIGWRLGWTLPLSVGVVDSEETLSTRAFIHEKTGTLELNDCCKWGQRRLVNEPCQCNSGLFPALRSIDAEPHHARIAWIRPDQTGAVFLANRCLVDLHR